MYSKISLYDSSNHRKPCDLTQQKSLLSQSLLGDRSLKSKHWQGWLGSCLLCAQCVLRLQGQAFRPQHHHKCQQGSQPSRGPGSILLCSFHLLRTHGNLVSVHIHTTFFPWVSVTFIFCPFSALIIVVRSSPVQNKFILPAFPQFYLQKPLDLILS